MRKLIIKMNNISKLSLRICCILMLFIPKITIGQDITSPMVMASQLHNGKVYLRWVPADVDEWEKNMNDGYNIERFTLSIDGVPLIESEQEASKEVLVTNFKPLAAPWNMGNFQNPQLAEVGEHILYSNEFDATFIPSNFAEIVELQKTQANKFTFSLMVTDRDFELAQAFALGMIDDHVDSKAKYAYTLASSKDSKTVLTSTVIDMQKAKELVQIEKLATYGADKTIVLEWDNVSTSSQYSSYFIERSADGVHFEVLNEAPFVYSQDSKVKEKSSKAYYKDQVPMNGVDYFYRVIGISPFGIQGPASQVVKGQGVPGRMDIVLTAAIGSEDTDMVMVKWGGISEQQEQYIEKFEVHRSNEIYEGYEEISNGTLTKGDREFYDQDPLYAGYYVVTMVDVNGHYYKSRVVMAQPSDTTPPAIPSGFAATVDKNGAVTLNWNANTEDDFEGYRLFRSNLRDANFVDVANEDIYDENYVDYLTTDMLTDSVFYGIKSSDIRGNHSEMSEIIALARPNSLPPSAALMLNLYPSNDGVKVSWVLSQSSDLASHTLERKPKNRQGWDPILEFDIDSELMTQTFGDDLMKYNYVDIEKLDQVVYQYRLIASDADGNQSVSNMLEVQPLFNNIDGNIYDFAGEAICDVIVNSELAVQISSLESAAQAINANPGNTNSILLDLLQNGTITYTQYANYVNNASSIGQNMNNQIGGLNNELTALSCKVLLNWAFKSDYEVRKVELFRAAGNETLDHYKDYDILDVITEENTENMAIIDDDVEIGMRYRYKILIHLVNRMTSPLSEEITVQIEE